MDYSASEKRSMFLRLWTYTERLLPCVMIPRLLDIPVIGRCWNWYPIITGRPQMFWYIGQYISTYDLYLWTKVVRYSPAKELYLLSIPDTRWDTLSINFVVELPKSSAWNAVMIVVDLISKRAHFILTYTTVIAEEVVRLFFYNM